jgi:hypothetical protein
MNQCLGPWQDFHSTGMGAPITVIAIAHPVLRGWVFVQVSRLVYQPKGIIMQNTTDSRRVSNYGMPRERTTVPLNSTIKDTQASLNAEAAFALDFALAWLGKAGSLKVRQSAVIRRALDLYVQHLEACTQPGGDPEQEVRMVHRASESMNREDHLQAPRRLQAVPANAPLPPYRDLLEGPNRWDVAAFNEGVDKLMAALSTSKYCKLRGIE